MAESNANQATRRERPLSPHLSIYKPQLSSFTSISHRASGVFLTLGLFVLVRFLWEIAMPGGCNCVGTLLLTIPGKMAIALWLAAFYYHMFNGVRHLFWDAGKGFEVKTADKTGWLVIIGAIVATTITCFLAATGGFAS